MGWGVTFSWEDAGFQTVTVKAVNALAFGSLASGDREAELRGQIAVLEDKRAEDPLRRMQRQDVLRLVTRGCSDTERLIVVLYYYEGLTLKEIGEVLGVTESRVSQLHTKAVLRLRGRIKEDLDLEALSL